MAADSLTLTSAAWLCSLEPNKPCRALFSMPKGAPYLMASFPSKPSGIGSVSLARTGSWLLPALTSTYPLLPLSQYEGLRKKAGGCGTPYLPESETEKVKHQPQNFHPSTLTNPSPATASPVAAERELPAE